MSDSPAVQAPVEGAELKRFIEQLLTVGALLRKRVDEWLRTDEARAIAIAFDEMQRPPLLPPVQVLRIEEPPAPRRPIGFKRGK